MKQTTEHAQAAKMIRKILKEKFPGQKAIVRSQSFAGGNAIDVYIGGKCKTREDNFTIAPDCPENALRRDVKSQIRQFKYGKFDGMQDLYEYTNVRDDIPQVKYLHVKPLHHAA